VTDIRLLFAGVAVSDLEGGVAWYEALFGRPADVVVNDKEVMWKLSDTSWLYVVLDPDRAGGGLVALSVADLDLALDALQRRGLSGGPIETVGDAGRKAVFTDTDGNAVSIIEVKTS
jgi:predicted enzyme related to lactoylglutathione lyase